MENRMNTSSSCRNGHNKNRAIRLIGDVALSSSLKSLYIRRKISDLCLFHRYSHGRCSAEIPRPSPSIPARATRLTAKQHPYSIQLFTNRTAHFNSTFSLAHPVLGIPSPRMSFLQRKIPNSSNTTLSALALQLKSLRFF